MFKTELSCFTVTLDQDVDAQGNRQLKAASNSNCESMEVAYSLAAALIVEAEGTKTCCLEFVMLHFHRGSGEIIFLVIVSCVSFTFYMTAT